MTELKLHLGCGDRYIPGWAHVDAVPWPHVLQSGRVGQIDKLPWAADNSVDIIYSCHCLEHFHRKDTLNVLREWFRVIKPEGLLRIAVPDMEALFKLYIKLNEENHSPVQDHLGNNQSYALNKVIGSIYGRGSYLYNFHSTGFDEKTLKLMLEQVGFLVIGKYDRWVTEHADVDDFSAAYYPHLDRNGVLLSLNMEAIKP